MGNCVCLCVYFKKSLTLEKQGQFFLLQGMCDIIFVSFLLTPGCGKCSESLAYRTVALQDSGDAYS